MKQNFFSIVIPTYESNGNGVKLLEDLFNSILIQSFTDYDVIVSDHSTNQNIENLVKNWKSNFKIHYLKNDVGIGNSSINMNNGIKFSTGKFIKIMHIDDYFSNEKSLQIIYNQITSSEKEIIWGVVGFNYFSESENKIKDIVIPKNTYNPIIGYSAMNGCPSISFFKNNLDIFFEENLIIINDFELFFRLKNLYGEPMIIEELSVTIRLHDNQVTKILKNYSDKENKEINYFKNKIS